jgi:hypothetical protein
MGNGRRHLPLLEIEARKAMAGLEAVRILADGFLQLLLDRRVGQ